MKVLAITQARSGSTRFPKKILRKIGNNTLLEIHIERIKKSQLINNICIATTTNSDDDIIVDLANQLDVNYYRGSEEDVLDRFYQAAQLIKPDLIVRLTSDCTLIDSELLDEVISTAKARKIDYYSNTLEDRFPDGQDIEVVTFNALKKAWELAELRSDREHVTSFIRNNSTYNGGDLFQSDNHDLSENYNKVRLTVDVPEDLEVIRKLIRALGIDKGWIEYAEMYLQDVSIKSLNENILRNEGYLTSIEND